MTAEHIGEIFLADGNVRNHLAVRKKRFGELYEEPLCSSKAFVYDLKPILVSSEEEFWKEIDKLDENKYFGEKFCSLCSNMMNNLFSHNAVSFDK